MHKALILLVRFQPCPPKKRRRNREILLLFYLGKKNAKTRPGLSSSKPRYLKPALSVKIYHQNLHLRKKKMKKSCENKLTQSVTTLSLIVHFLRSHCCSF